MGQMCVLPKCEIWFGERRLKTKAFYHRTASAHCCPKHTQDAQASLLQKSNILVSSSPLAQDSWKRQSHWLWDGHLFWSSTIPSTSSHGRSQIFSHKVNGHEGEFFHDQSTGFWQRTTSKLNVSVVLEVVISVMNDIFAKQIFLCQEHWMVVGASVESKVFLSILSVYENSDIHLWFFPHKFWRQCELQTFCGYRLHDQILWLFPLVSLQNWQTVKISNTRTKWHPNSCVQLCDGLAPDPSSNSPFTKQPAPRSHRSMGTPNITSDFCVAHLNSKVQSWSQWEQPSAYCYLVRVRPLNSPDCHWISIRKDIHWFQIRMCHFVTICRVWQSKLSFCGIVFRCSPEQQQIYRFTFLWWCCSPEQLCETSFGENESFDPIRLLWFLCCEERKTCLTSPKSSSGAAR